MTEFVDETWFRLGLLAEFLVKGSIRMLDGRSSGLARSPATITFIGVKNLDIKAHFDPGSSQKVVKIEQTIAQALIAILVVLTHHPSASASFR